MKNKKGFVVPALVIILIMILMSVFITTMATDKYKVAYTQVWEVDIAGPAMNTLLKSTDEQSKLTVSELLNKAISLDNPTAGINPIVGRVDVMNVIKKKIGNRECLEYNCEFCVEENTGKCLWEIRIENLKSITMDKAFFKQSETSYIQKTDGSRVPIHLTLWR